MNKKKFRQGVFTTMVTPYTEDNSIDYFSLEKFISWQEKKGADGLFAVCQSSEMFFLSLEEKMQLASFVKRESSLEVIASGHTQKKIHDQVEAMKAMESTGVDAVVLLSNAFADESENDDVMLGNLDIFLEKFNSKVPLGLYECPYPYKRLLSERVFKYIIESGRFFIMKDTSCDGRIIKDRLEVIGDRDFGLYNANAETVAFSSLMGAAGYSGVHANISPKLVKFVMDNPLPMNNSHAEIHRLLYDFSYFLREAPYPSIAKVMLEKMGIFTNSFSRVFDSSKIERRLIEKAFVYIERISDFEVTL